MTADASATLDPDAAVSVRDLRKTYGSITALDGVSFDIARGETFALLGPNGAGKSTTIEILEGYRDRTGGSAQVLGLDPHRGGVDVEGPPRHRAPVERRVGRRDRARAVDAFRRPLPASARRRRGDRRGRTRPRRRRRASRTSPAASAAGSMSRSVSSAGPRCCSSTSRRPASTRRRGASSGSSSAA